MSAPDRSLLQAITAVVTTALALLVNPLAAQWESDQWLASPVDDATFATFLDFFRYDADLAFELERLGTEDRDGIAREHLAFQSTPGMRVTAHWYHVAAAPGQARPALIVVHGGVSRGKDGGVPRIAERLVRSGFDVMAIDLLHFGERNTGLLTTFTEEDKHEHLYNQPSAFLDWVAQSVKDVGRTIDLLVADFGAAPDRIGYVGFSRGGQIGFVIGGAERRLRVVASLYSGHFDRAETGHLAAACPANYIGRISPRPFYMLNGNFDTDYDKEKSVIPLQELAGESTTFRWVDTGHTLPPADAVTEMVEWLAEHMR